MTALAQVRPKDIPKPGRNDPCWCGTGEKYKKCHRDADDEEERQEFGVELESDHPSHPGHPVCDVYYARPSKLPANLRPEFHHLLNTMQTSGATLLHVPHPTMLALDQKDYDAVLAKLAKGGITAHCPGDPTPEQLVVANAYVDRIFGPGVYRIVPASRSVKNYPGASEQAAEDGVYEAAAPAVAGVGPMLYRCKLHEAGRLVEAGLPDLIVESYAIADLIRDLVYDCADLPAEFQLHDDDPWGGLLGILAPPSEIAAGDPEPTGWLDGGVNAIAYRVAVGLAFPDCRDDMRSSEIDRLQGSPELKGLLNRAADAMRADPGAMALLPASRDLLTPTHLKAWQAEVHERLSQSADGLAADVELVGQPASEIAVEAVAIAPALAAQVAAPPPRIALADLFAGFDEARTVSEERDSQIREEIRAQDEIASGLAGKVTELRAKLKHTEAETEAAELRLKELGEAAGVEIERARTAQAAALVETLRLSERGLEGRPDWRWKCCCQLLKTPSRPSWQPSSRAMSSLSVTAASSTSPPPSEQRWRLRPSELAARWAWAPPRRLRPCRSCRFRCCSPSRSRWAKSGSASPYRSMASSPAPLGPTTVEGAVAAMGIGVLTSMIHDHGSDDNRAKVTAMRLPGGLSQVWISAVMSGADGTGGAQSHHDEQHYLQLLCDVPAEHLRSIGVEVAPMVIAADIMDELSQVAE